MFPSHRRLFFCWYPPSWLDGDDDDQTPFDKRALHDLCRRAALKGSGHDIVVTRQAIETVAPVALSHDGEAPRREPYARPVSPRAIYRNPAAAAAFAAVLAIGVIISGVAPPAGNRAANRKEAPFVPIPYLAPFSTAWTLQWSGQWRLDSWPNLAFTLLLFAYAGFRFQRAAGRFTGLP